MNRRGFLQGMGALLATSAMVRPAAPAAVPTLLDHPNPGARMNYGTCHGGPWNKKQLADARDVYLVAIDAMLLKKVLPGMQRATHPHQDVRWCEYRWLGGGRGWEWFDPLESLASPQK